MSGVLNEILKRFLVQERRKVINQFLYIVLAADDINVLPLPQFKERLLLLILDDVRGRTDLFGLVPL